MRRTLAAGAFALTATGVAGGVLLTAANANSAGRPVTQHPREEIGALACGSGPALVVHTGLYVPMKDEHSAARSPEAVIDGLLAKHYPKAARTAFVVVEKDGGYAKYHARGTGGHLLASVLVANADGEHYLEELALCETTAQRWSR